MNAASPDAAPATGAFAVSGRGWGFSGALTFDDAAVVLQASRALALPEAATVDMSALTHADSAALAVLIALKRRAAAEGRTLTIVGLPRSLHSLAVVYGIEDLLA